jgi:tight adherence protein C
MLVLAIIAVVLLGAGVMLLLKGSASAGGGDTVAQIESYGFNAPSTAESSGPSQRPLGALASGLGGLVQRVMGTGEQGIRSQLLAAGMYDVEPVTIIGYRVLAAAVAAAFGIWFTVGAGKPIFVIVLGTAALAGLGWALPVFYLSRKARIRTERIEYELPELIDLLVVTLEAGLSFLASLQTAAQRLEGPLGDELRLAMQEQRMGLTANDALQGILRRAETPALRAFVRSVLQGEALGVSTGAIMRNLALEMRKRRRAAAEERAQKAPVKMLFPLIFLVFPAMFVVLLGPAAYSIQKILGSG